MNYMNYMIFLTNMCYVVNAINHFDIGKTCPIWNLASSNKNFFKKWNIANIHMNTHRSIIQNATY